MVKMKYIGDAPGADTSTYPLFDSTVAFPGANYFQMHGYKRLVIDLTHNASGTLNWYKSDDRGDTWTQLGTESLAAPTYSDQIDIWVEPYSDMKVEWVNGGSAQTSWIVDLALTDERSVAV
jgi:cellulose biosynthesis protein BcsQ